MFSLSKSLICASLLLSGSLCMAQVPLAPGMGLMEIYLRNYYIADHIAKKNANDWLKGHGYLPDDAASQARRLKWGTVYQNRKANLLFSGLIIGGLIVTVLAVDALIVKGKNIRLRKKMSDTASSSLNTEMGQLPNSISNK